MLKKVLVLGILCGAASAFAQSSPEPQTQTPSTPSVTLTDAQIAEALMEINEGEIDAAKMAKSKAKNPEVVAFAKMMKNDHEKNKDATKKLAKKQDIGTKDSDYAEQLEDDAESANKSLKNADKGTFDKTYIDQQVIMHEKALAAIREALLPNAKNQALRDHLKQTETAVSQHLTHVKGIQAKL